MKVKELLSAIGLTGLILLMVCAVISLSNDTSSINNDIVTFKTNHQFRKTNHIRINMFLPSNKKCVEKCKKEEIGSDKGYPCGQSYQVCCLGERNCKKGSIWDTCKEKVNAFFCEG